MWSLRGVFNGVYKGTGAIEIVLKSFNIPSAQLFERKIKNSWNLEMLW